MGYAPLVAVLADVDQLRARIAQLELEVDRWRELEEESPPTPGDESDLPEASRRRRAALDAFIAAYEAEHGKISENEIADAGRRRAEMPSLPITATLRVETEASVWQIEPDRYLRLPKTETPRR